MTYCIQALVAVALLSVALASPAANYYVDTILSGPLQNELRLMNLEPARLADFHTEFYDKKPIVGKVKGKADYNSGNLTGLSKVLRFSECQGPSYSYGTANINCTIGFSSLSTVYRGKVKYGVLPKVSIKAKGNITTTALFVNFVRMQGSQYGQINNLQFQQIGNIKTKFTGLGSVLNKFLTVLEDGYTSHVRAETMNVILSNFRFALNKAASLVQMPN